MIVLGERRHILENTEIFWTELDMHKDIQSEN